MFVKTSVSNKGLRYEWDHWALAQGGSWKVMCLLEIIIAAPSHCCFQDPITLLKLQEQQVGVMQQQRLMLDIRSTSVSIGNLSNSEDQTVFWLPSPSSSKLYVSFSR